MVFIFSKKLFSFLRYWTICQFFPFLSTVSRFKGSDSKMNLPKHVLQLKERVITVPRLFCFHDLVCKWGLGANEKLSSDCCGLFKNFKSLLHVLPVLGNLPKVRRVMGLAFSADFLHTFCIKMFLIKYPIK